VAVYVGRKSTVSCSDSEIVENGSVCCILAVRLRFLHMRTRHRLLHLYIIYFVLFCILLLLSSLSSSPHPLIPSVLYLIFCSWNVALKCRREHSKSKWLPLVSHLCTRYNGAWVGHCISFLNFLGGLTVYGAVPFSAGFVVCHHGNFRFKVHRLVQLPREIIC
jgi:hypothetical protein